MLTNTLKYINNKYNKIKKTLYNDEYDFKYPFGVDMHYIHYDMSKCLLLDRHGSYDIELAIYLSIRQRKKQAEY
jgi:hypothetical protein